ncbi:helix-turn-helix domain-containing protein [Actinoplanes sp. GCM10030250]|uniref:helix-turn-helix domain-containing protein n=1 Tax=Actinoplanes sp. GCM10030250 TaxID=3273376 RepID=UPI00361B2FB9
MPLLRRVIGAVLRRVRQHQGRTLRDVAETAGVSLPYLSEVERGTKEASSEVLAAICRALGLPLPELLDEVRRELLRQAPAPRMGGPATGVSRVGVSQFVTQRSRPAGGAASGPQVRCVSGRLRRGTSGGRPRAAVRLGCGRGVTVFV